MDESTPTGARHEMRIGMATGGVDVDGYSTPGRGEKRHLEFTPTDEENKRARDDVITQSPTVPQGKLVVYMTGRYKVITLVKPDTVRKSIQDQFGIVTDIDKAGRSLRIICQTLKQKNQMLQGGNIVADIEVRCSEPHREVPLRPIRAVTTKVVVGGVPIDFTEEEICTASDAKQAYRFVKKTPEGTLKTTTVLLTYDGEDSAPERFMMDYLNFRTREYKVKAMRCYKCQEFGHKTSQCRRTQVKCVLCAGNHAEQDCNSRDALKCANCGGEHSAASKACGRYIEVSDTLKVVATEKVTYKEALTKVREAAKERQVAEAMAMVITKQTHNTENTPATTQQVDAQAVAEVCTQATTTNTAAHACTNIEVDVTKQASDAVAITKTNTVVSIAVVAPKPADTKIEYKTMETQTDPEVPTQTKSLEGEGFIKIDQLLDLLIKLIALLSGKDEPKGMAKTALDIAISTLGLSKEYVCDKIVNKTSRSRRSSMK